MKFTHFFVACLLFVSVCTADPFSEIYDASSEIAKIDQDSMKPAISEHLENEQGSKKLFLPIETPIPHSYLKTNALAELFNPEEETNEHKKLEHEINEYLGLLSKSPVIQYALKITKTTITDLKNNWFGSGRGFEHVMVGEIEKGAISGYHWWYRFYCEEKEGNAHYMYTINSQNDPGVFTGAFSWDPDGTGPLEIIQKKKGGFLVGPSPAAMLALGHVVFEITKKYQLADLGYGALKFKAKVGEKDYTFQLYLFENNIRSIFPRTEIQIENFNSLF